MKSMIKKDEARLEALILNLFNYKHEFIFY
jgi:hypothetical protein